MVTSGSVQKRATIAMDAARRAGAADLKDRVQLDLITLALHGKKIGFEKVVKMIDDMIATLKQEQIDDDNKKEYCGVQADSADEIAALGAGIKALDKAVAEATEQRKE